MDKRERARRRQILDGILAQSDEMDPYDIDHFIPTRDALSAINDSFGAAKDMDILTRSTGREEYLETCSHDPSGREFPSG